MLLGDVSDEEVHEGRANKTATYFTEDFTCATWAASQTRNLFPLLTSLSFSFLRRHTNHISQAVCAADHAAQPIGMEVEQQSLISSPMHTFRRLVDLPETLYSAFPTCTVSGRPSRDRVPGGVGASRSSELTDGRPTQARTSMALNLLRTRDAFDLPSQTPCQISDEEIS